MNRSCGSIFKREVSENFPIICNQVQSPPDCTCSKHANSTEACYFLILSESRIYPIESLRPRMLKWRVRFESNHLTEQC